MLFVIYHFIIQKKSRLFAVLLFKYKMEKPNIFFLIDSTNKVNQWLNVYLSYTMHKKENLKNVIIVNRCAIAFSSFPKSLCQQTRTRA